MPLYEFECAKCQKVFEELCPVGSAKPPCPVCRSRKVNKLMSSFAVRGSGASSARGGNSGGGGSACGGCSGGNCASCH